MAGRVFASTLLKLYENSTKFSKIVEENRELIIKRLSGFKGVRGNNNNGFALVINDMLFPVLFESYDENVLIIECTPPLFMHDLYIIAYVAIKGFTPVLWIRKHPLVSSRFILCKLRVKERLLLGMGTMLELIDEVVKDNVDFIPFPSSPSWLKGEYVDESRLYANTVGFHCGRVHPFFGKGKELDLSTMKLRQLENVKFKPVVEIVDSLLSK